MNDETEIGIALEKLSAAIETLHGAMNWTEGNIKNEVSTALEHLNFALGFLSAQRREE